MRLFLMQRKEINKNINKSKITFVKEHFHRKDGTSFSCPIFNLYLKHIMYLLSSADSETKLINHKTLHKYSYN